MHSMDQMSSEVETNYLNTNLKILNSNQPFVSKQILKQISSDTVQIQYSQSGHSVPIFRGIPIHSLVNPIEEGHSLIMNALGTQPQKRIVMVGFGFGYHIEPLIELGFSPLVYICNSALFLAALKHRDLSHILPFVTFYFGDDYPDLPRLTEVLSHSILESFFPEAVMKIKSRIITDYPKNNNTIESGVYYGTYGNVTCLKNPLDLMVYNQLLFLIRPTLIIEIGTCRGGSALYLADLLQSMGGDRRIHTYDVVDQIAPEIRWDSNIYFHSGGWTDFHPDIIKKNDRVLIIEDSSHTYENTLAVLKHFAPYVTPNSYFIVEDGATTISRPEFNGGPTRAVEEFLVTNSNFEIDEQLENRYGKGNSNCLKGFLRKKS